MRPFFVLIVELNQNKSGILPLLLIKPIFDKDHPFFIGSCGLNEIQQKLKQHFALHSSGKKKIHGTGSL